MRIIWFVAALLIVTITQSAAERLKIDPRCKSFKDKVHCTCALQNGGSIVRGADGRKWVYNNAPGSNRPLNEAAIQCSARYRR